MKTCKYCGCSASKACIVRLDSQPGAIQTNVRQYYLARGAPIPRHIGCSWVSHTPPVCSNPSCVAKHQASLPAAPTTAVGHPL